MSDRASEWRQATLFDDELEVVRPDNIKAGINCGNLDALRDAGKSVFGGGWFLSERAAAERAAGISVQLSPREWEIVKRLSR